MIKSTIVGQRYFDDNVEISTITSIDLPGVTTTTVEIKGPGIMGTINVPSTGQIEGAEYVVHTRGIDAANYRLARPGVHKHEVRVAQDVYNQSTGAMTTESVKYFLSGIYKSSEGGSIVDGSLVEGSATYELKRMQIIVNGKEVFLIDKDRQEYVINGTDHYANVRKALS